LRSWVILSYQPLSYLKKRVLDIWFIRTSKFVCTQNLNFQCVKYFVLCYHCFKCSTRSFFDFPLMCLRKPSELTISLPHKVVRMLWYRNHENVKKASVLGWKIIFKENCPKQVERSINGVLFNLTVSQVIRFTFYDHIYLNSLQVYKSDMYQKERFEIAS